MFQRLLLLLGVLSMAAAQPVGSAPIMHVRRSATGDLEIGGELAGLPAGSTRFVRYEDLLRLPQETYTVSDDTNFRGKTVISGIALDQLAKIFGKSADIIVAICYDRYRTNYPRDYRAAHHPLLVLRINGQERDHWPPSEYGGTMGPFLISHPYFKPSFKVLSHEDEPQIPFGVTRLEFRREAQVWGAIRPRGDWASHSKVGQGYIIARQDCFRCHNMGAQGGTMAGRSWLQLASIAKWDGVRFRRIIHDPAAVTPGAKMPAHGDYDEATLDALTAYFRTFAGSGTRSATPARRRPTT